MNNPCNQPCPYNTLRGCTILEHPGKYCPMGNMAKKENKPITNGDHIRAMTDEELAKVLSDTVLCVPEGRCHRNPKASCYECWTNWLKQPAKEET